MANILAVPLQNQILSLYLKGLSKRQIARELGVNRRSVTRYIERLAKCAISNTGSELGTREPKPAAGNIGKSKCTISNTGILAGRRSACVGFEAVIAEKCALGLSVQRIFEDLREIGFEGSYQSVRRFVEKADRAQGQGAPLRVWRIETRPGEEAQVDFCKGPLLKDPHTGRNRQTWVFRMVLSFSRKGYSEAVYRQDGETFIRVMENAFRSLGGVPLLMRVDNLKAAVKQADWMDPQISPKFAEFCRHYRVDIVPCRPYHPQHKGKVERNIAYVKGNALKGRNFESLGELNAHLVQWESRVADQRIHGTTRKQVAAVFEHEAEFLQALPPALFESFTEGRRRVSRDSFVEWRRAFYEVPPEYIGRDVWVRWDGRCVRILNEKLELLQTHAPQEPGRYSHTLGSMGMSGPVRFEGRRLVNQAAAYGAHCRQWASLVLEKRGSEGLRTLFGIKRLGEKYAASDLDAACALAVEEGVYSVRALQRLLQSPEAPVQLKLAESHPVIRPMSAYQSFFESLYENTQCPSNRPRNHPATSP
jgi:transposase